jgi:MoxR-like ATPase
MASCSPMSSETAQSRLIEDDLRAVEDVARAREEVLEQLGRRVVGQREVIELLLIALFSRGHCLFVGVPGLAKTLLISSLAELLNLEFSRIQFTPDLMPSDITGTEVLQEDRASGVRSFRFLRGPIFANLVLADEINRTPPKTQAALLQAMQEYRVTAGGETHELSLPFLVFATQNPIEQEGTYPLPEAQLDRFMFQVDVTYPSEDEEVLIVQQSTGDEELSLHKVLSPERIQHLQDLVRRVPVAEHVVRYAVRLARTSRPEDPAAPVAIRDYVSWGAGPRASQYLVAAGKAKALLEGRYAVRIDDIAALAKATLQHRLVRNFRAEADGITTASLVDELLRAAKA